MFCSVVLPPHSQICSLLLCFFLSQEKIRALAYRRKGLRPRKLVLRVPLLTGSLAFAGFLKKTEKCGCGIFSV